MNSFLGLRFIASIADYCQLKVTWILDGIHGCQKSGDVVLQPTESPTFNQPFLFVLPQKQTSVATLILSVNIIIITKVRTIDGDEFKIYIRCGLMTWRLATTSWATLFSVQTVTCQHLSIGLKCKIARVCRSQCGTNYSSNKTDKGNGGRRSPAEAEIDQIWISFIAKMSVKKRNMRALLRLVQIGYK